MRKTNLNRIYSLIINLQIAAILFLLLASLTAHGQQVEALQQENLELRARIAQLEFDLNESQLDVEPYFQDNKPICPRADYDVKYKVQMKTICAGTKTIQPDEDNGYEEEHIEQTGCEDRRVFVPVCRKHRTPNPKP